MDRLVRNAAECGECGDVIESRHRHDFVWCSCGNLAVDGGLDYAKRLFGNGNWIERSRYEEPK